MINNDARNVHFATLGDRVITAFVHNRHLIVVSADCCGGKIGDNHGNFLFFTFVTRIFDDVLGFCRKADTKRRMRLGRDPRQDVHRWYKV